MMSGSINSAYNEMFFSRHEVYVVNILCSKHSEFEFFLSRNEICYVVNILSLNFFCQEMKSAM